MGIASLLLMILIPYLTLAMVLEHMAKKANSEDKSFRKCVKALDSVDMDAVFLGEVESRSCTLDIWRQLQVCRLCGRAVFNIFLFSYSLANAPRREPEEPLNQTKHVLIWLEFFGTLVMSLLFLLMDIISCCGRCLDVPVYSLYRARVIRSVANFSALTLLRLANPADCLDRLKDAFNKRKAAMFLAEVVSAVFGAAPGVAALVVKISATTFVADTLFYNWGPSQWLTLVGFLNNIAGLLTIQEMRIETRLLLCFYSLSACH